MMSLEKMKQRQTMENALRFKSWYPLLQKAGLKQPKSHTIEPDMMGLLHHIALDIHTTKERYKEDLEFLVRSWCGEWLDEAVKELGDQPLFFKLDTYSDKHHLDKVFIETHRELYARIIQCFCNGELQGVATRPASLVFREPLDIKGLVLLDDSVLPIAVERRAFWVDGKIEKVIPYWPLDAFDAQGDELKDIHDYLVGLNAVSHEAILPEVEKAGKALEALHPNWSIDFALDASGEWWLIDCAPAEMSWGYVKKAGE
jgi:hypothetical protein